MKVMVVDDEKDIEILFRQKFRKEIQQGKIAFHFAFSAEEAIEYLQHNGTTELVLILSDINMPGLNGLELLNYIKKHYPKGPKVYMITAYGNDENHQLAVEYGCDEYLTKPIDFAELKEKIMSSI